MKSKKLIITFILFGIFGFVVGRTVINFKKDHDSTEQIQSILETHCNCEKIKKTMYAKGVQYNNDDGFTTEKVEYQLINCAYSNFNEEVERIDQLLKDQVEGFETFDQITLDFVSENHHQKISFNNGKIQQL
ncbi:hypothetical protein LX77_01999 [Gelidibacter algens]|uniref:Uncharacterized protein n=1 Tax=Gelidibacter algens TaxID=49280 RepID=A0A1A7R605_9FLAO|nr:hypothetical protein [Gelidibacter algens]OBX26182.1 hypothetical protein A9996_06575 [Gelidibacter algens]RAJ24447.1 hypothetical protein LX77_01999 [Gelidibacter algens]